MEEGLQRARAARTLVERLGTRIPGFSGYLERELRREVDQLLRRHLATRLDQARDAVAAFVRRLPLSAGDSLGRLGSCEKQLDSLANTLRHAGSGYRGLFDAVKVREEELAALYRFDLGLVDEVDAVIEAAGQLADDDAVVARLENTVSQVRSLVSQRDDVLEAAFRAAGGPLPL